MQINVECPVCQTKYFLQSDLVGKAMKCSTCDERFVIQEMAEPPLMLDAVEEPKPEPPELASMVPMLQAELVQDSVLELEPVESHEEPIPELPVVEFTEAEFRVRPAPQESEIFFGPRPKFDSTAPPPEPEPWARMKTEPMRPVPSRPVAPLPEATHPEVLPPKAPEPDRTLPQFRPPAVANPVPSEPIEVRWGSSIEPPRPVEVRWQDAPLPPVQLPEGDEFDETEEPETPSKGGRKPRRRARPVYPAGAPKKRRKGVLVFLVMFVVAGVVGGGIWYRGYVAREPERLFAKAEKEYKENRPGPAATAFQTIVKDHPKFPRYKEAVFFYELSTLKAAVFSITNVTDPQPAIDQSKLFLTAVQNPEVKPFAGRDKFGVDVWQTLVKLADDVAAKAKKEFDQDKPEETERWIQYLESAKPTLADYRPKDTPPESVLQEIDGLKVKVAAARIRLGALAQIDQQLSEPDDERIGLAKKIARGFQLEGDPAVLKKLDDADKKLQGRVAYKRIDPPLPAKPLKDDGLTGLLFATRLDTPNPLSKPPAAGTAGIYFAVARGMLYALDEVNGRVRWATRVGIDTDSLPLRVPASETHPEIVLVTVNDGPRSSITARLTTNGEPIWSEPLESPALGCPVQVGNRVFVTLKDPVPRPPKNDVIGVIYEIELTNGLLVGRLSLGRPLASGGVRQMGTGLVYFPAEGKSVYVFDVLKLDENGSRLDPQLLGVLNTEHPPGTLRNEPVLSGSDGEAAGPRYLLLSQTEGLNEMKLRAFPLPQGDIPKAAPVPVEIPLTGWSWFSPYCDGEKLAVVTDRGEFGLFGINQAGNQDVPIFKLPQDAFKIPKADTPSRGQLIHAEEGAFWILARGQITRVRIGLDAAEGIKVNVFGTPVPVGEPIHAAQVTPRGDAFLVVTQPTDSSGCLATMVEMPTGEIRWQRQLGMLVQGSPVSVGDTIFAVDQDCGLYQFDPKKLSSASEGAWLLDDAWLLGSPLKNLRTLPELFAVADGKGVVAVATQDLDGLKLLVRSYQSGEMITRSFPLSAMPAGRPAMFGNYLLLPLTTGTVFRINVKELQKLEEGPSWRNDRLNPDAVCRVVALSDDEFLATDGSRTVQRFKWPAENPFESRAKITWVEKIDSPLSVAKQGDRTLLSFADVKGAVTVWDAGFPVKPLRVWRGKADGPIPVGPVTQGPTLYPGDQLRLAYTVDSRSLVWLDPEKDLPLWVAPKPLEVRSDGPISLPTLTGDQLLYADRAGWFQFLNAKTGQFVGKPVSISGNVAPSAAPVKLDGGAALAPVSDGTLLLIRQSGIGNRESGIGKE